MATVPMKQLRAPRTRRQGRLRAWFSLVSLAVMLLGASPLAAQYGGVDNSLFVDPRIPLDQTINGFGTGCAAGATVEITIDGVPGVLTTTIATADGNYSIVGLPLPDGLLAGEDYTVRASCGAVESTALITVLCYDGNLPVGGECQDGSDGTSGGTPPTTTTTTTTTTQPGGSDGGDGGDGSAPPDLAVTGLSYGEYLLPAAASLLAGGWFLILVARRRDDDSTYV